MKLLIEIRITCFIEMFLFLLPLVEEFYGSFRLQDYDENRHAELES